MKHTYQGINYTVIGNHIVFNYENQVHSLKLEMGVGASRALDSFIRQLKRESKQPVIVYSNNKFGDYWKSCWYGEFKVTKTDQLYLHVQYQGTTLKIECYKHPFHLAAAILKGTPDHILATINQIREFQSQGLIAGKDYTISTKGVIHT